MQITRIEQNILNYNNIQIYNCSNVNQKKHKIKQKVYQNKLKKYHKYYQMEINMKAKQLTKQDMVEVSITTKQIKIIMIYMQENGYKVKDKILELIITIIKKNIKVN